MPSIYLIDEINIVSESKDINGAITSSTASGISARVEDEERWVKDKMGNQQLARTLIIVESSVSVGWDDKVQIAKRGGTAQTQADKKWPIKSLHVAEGFTASHKEIWI